MDCFSHMMDLYFESFSQFTSDVDAKRERMLKVPISEIKQIPLDIDLNSIEKLPNGRWNAKYRGIDFECFFHYKESKFLYVFLNGAVTEVDHFVPMFKRWSYYKFMNGSMLNILDPMYKLYDNLMLGWYYGTKDVDFRQIISELVLRIAYILGIKQKNIIFVGSSGGGAAALGCANYIPHTKTLTINPQIILGEYQYSEKFERITGIDLTEKDKWNRNNAICYLLSGDDNINILFINLRSEDDMQQVRNICNSLEIKVTYGLNVFKNLVIWLYDADLSPYVSSHSLQENYCIWFMLEFIVLQSDNLEKLKSYSSLFRLINEFYYDRRKSEKNWRDKQLNLEQLWKCIHNNRKVAIWGSGEYTEYLNKEIFCIEERNYYQIQCVIDNDKCKQGKYHGLPIKHPEDIRDWTELFIIITSEQYGEQIKNQLEAMGLLFKRDFITYLRVKSFTSLRSQGIPIDS